MVWRTWRGVLGGSLAMLLLLAAPTAALWAQTPIPTAHPSVAKPTPKPATHTAAKTKPQVAKAAARHEPVRPTQKVAAKKKPGPAKKIEVAKRKPEPARRLEAAKRKPEPKKIEVAKKAGPVKLAEAEAKPAAASYTITTTHDGVTQTTTRIVPLTPAPVASVAVKPPAATKTAPPAEIKTAVAAPQPAAGAKPPMPGTQVASLQPQIAATPVSLTGPAAPAKTAGFAAIAAVSMASPIQKPVAEASAPVVDKPDAKEAAAFVSHFLKEAFQIAKSDGTSLQRRARLADLFASKMDVPRIAGYTTGAELTGAPSDIQQRFRTILVSYLVETYYPQLELASDPSVTVDTTPSETLPDGTAVVWTTFTKDGWGSQSVKWHLLDEGGHYRIVDIFSAGASLVQMERDTFLSVMRNGGLNELMAKLDQRTKQLATAATE